MMYMKVFYQAKRAGVRDENIILDPGIGFAKDLG